MANTYVDYTATAGQTDFNFSFPYLENDHVEVLIDGVASTAFTIALSPTRVVLNTAATGGEVVRVRRSSDPTEDLVDFVNGSILTESDLDRAYLHNRYLNEEAYEGNTSSLQTAAGGTNFDANFNKIINLAPPTNSLDAANKNYVDDKLVVSGTSLSGFNKSTHTGDNATTVFTLSFTAQTGTASAFRVAIDGVLQTPDDAYTVNTSTNQITFTSAPPTNAEIVVIATGTAQDVNSIGVTSTGSTTARSLADRFADVVNVLDYGADRTGQTDSASAIHAALSAASSGRTKVVYFPSGEYECSTAITVPTNVSLIGEDCRVYHYYYDTDNPRMPVLRFTNDTDGIIFTSQFFKNQIKNLGIWSGLTVGTSTGVGLRLSTEDDTLVGESRIEGLGSVYENVEVYGFHTGVLIWGPYSWYQHFKDFQAHNCQVGFDIECLSTHHTKLDHVYINVDSGGPINHADRRGIIMRGGGRVTVENAIIENQGYSIEIAPIIYSDKADSADDKQLYISNLYTEAMLQGVFLFTASGYVKVNNCRASYGFYGSFCNFIRLETSSPTEKTYISMDELQFVGEAAPSNRRLRKIFSAAGSNTPSTYDVSLTNVELFRNEFEVLWEVNYPPTYITFKERDDGGSLVKAYQKSNETARVYATLENDLGNVPTNSLQWTTTHGTTVNLATLTNQLTTNDPIRPKNTNRKPVRYETSNTFNNNTYNFNDLSGIRYVNFGGGLTSFSVTIDTTHMNRGDEFLITDTPSTSGATATVTFGSQTFTCNSQEFIVVRKTVESGSSTAEAYRVVARGAV